eukprot:jgi/Undpi1/12098/HiC_scaffold_41.g14071.m1
MMTKYYGVVSSGIAVYDEAMTEGTVIACYAEPGWPESKGVKIPVDDNLYSQHIFEHKRALAVADVQTDPLLEPLHDVMRAIGIASMLIIPIVSGGRVLATMGFDAAEYHEFDKVAQEFGDRIGMVIGHVLKRKQSDAALRREQDFAQRIMGAMGQGLLVVDPEWRIEYCNPAFAELVGYSEDELWQMSMLQFMPAVDRANLEMLYMAWESDLTRNFDSGFIRADESELFVMLSLAPRHDGSEKSGHIVVVTDVSPRKEIEATQQAARDKAIEASRMKSEFLANMSHEIRTPLNGVIGMTSLLLNTQLSSEQLEYSETIRSSGELLLALINDILDFSKIEAGKLELEKQPFNLRSCIEEALDVVAVPASEKGLELAYWLHEAVPPTIIGDVTRLRQIIVNLLSNAVKFTHKGEVTINVKRLPFDEKRNKMALMCVEVSDTGIGIPPERMDRLFHSFSQVDSSTTRKFGGTGLGLAISKRLVEMMDGNVKVESTVGQGTTFSFTFAAEITPMLEQIYMQNLPALEGKQILVIDDNETNRKIITRQLSSWGIRSEALESGALALQRLNEPHEFDLLLLDLRMPEMDGLTFAETASRQFGSLPPIVILSSVGDSISVENNSLLAAGLTKPIKPGLLHKTIVKCMASNLVQSVTPPLSGKKVVTRELSTLRILLAEDNQVNQKVASRLLQKLGYRVDLASNGLEAVDSVRRQAYDVILMDVQMPEMDGVEATRIIRRELAREAQPHIIALTANAMVGDREKYLRAGMDDYVSKPVRMNTLREALMRVPQPAA